MSHPNYGKDFEKQIAEAMMKVPDIDVQRLYDPTNGYVGVRNPSDYIVYKYPYQYYIECKCTWENTLHKDYITQLDDLYKKSKTKGVIAGVFIWFIKHDVTVFITAESLVEHFKTHKSVNVKDVKDDPYLLVPGKKKRVFFDYDMESFFSR